MTRFIANIKRFVKRNNSTILSIIGSGGVIVTTILAIRATPKAYELIKADSRFNHDGDPYAYTKLEAIQSAWKCYIPTAISCIGTIFCIFGSDIISRNNKEALIGAYTLLSNSYEEYKSKMRELYGDEADKEVRGAMIRSKVDDNTGLMLSDEKFLFFEEYYGEFFTRTKEEVLLAEYHFNRNYQLRGYANLNELYALLDLHPANTLFGETVGWSVEAGECYYGYSWIDFDHELVTLDDGLECIYIHFPFPPTADYLDME